MKEREREGADENLEEDSDVVGGFIAEIGKGYGRRESIELTAEIKDTIAVASGFKQTRFVEVAPAKAFYTCKHNGGDGVLKTCNIHRCRNERVACNHVQAATENMLRGA